MLWRFLGILLLISPVGLAVSFYLIKRSARKQEPRQEGSALEFIPAPGMRLLLGLVLLLLTAFTVLVLVVAFFNGEGWYAVFIPLSFLVAILIANPRPVALDHNGIRQKRWLRGDREIAWAEIGWMERGWRTGITYVRSKEGGRPISFSPLLVGQSRFEREVRARTGGSRSDEDE
jgi:hypothetical protein